MPNEFLTPAEKQIAITLAEDIVRLSLAQKPNVALTAIGTALSILWCNRPSVLTAQDAIDEWRTHSIVIEALMRRHFGSVRYAEGEDHARS